MWKNEHGLSLVELLAAIVISTIIGFIAYGILFNGLKTYERVNVEANLRDEADYIMANLLNDFYLLKKSEIKESESSTNLPNSMKYIELLDGAKIGFVDGVLHLKDGTKYIIQNPSMKLGDSTKIIDKGQGQYEVHLTLEWIETNQSLTTISQMAIINDNE